MADPRVLGLDGPVVVVPTELLEPVMRALEPVADDARRFRAPLARPIADLVAALRAGAVAAQMQHQAANCGREHTNTVDIGAASPHRDVHALELSIDEAARRDGRSARQLRRLAAGGKLPGARKVGGRWVVELTDLRSA